MEKRGAASAGPRRELAATAGSPARRSERKRASTKRGSGEPRRGPRCTGAPPGAAGWYGGTWCRVGGSKGGGAPWESRGWFVPPRETGSLVGGYPDRRLLGRRRGLGLG